MEETLSTGPSFQSRPSASAVVVVRVVATSSAAAAQTLLGAGALLGPGAEDGADLGAIDLGLVGLVYRTLGLGKERIESAAEVIECRPVLVGGDQQDIRVVRSARLHHDYRVVDDEARLLGRLRLLLEARRQPVHVVVEVAVDGADGGDIEHRSIAPIAAVGERRCGGQRGRNQQRRGGADSLSQTHRESPGCSNWCGWLGSSGCARQPPKLGRERDPTPFPQALPRNSAHPRPCGDGRLLVIGRPGWYKARPGRRGKTLPPDQAIEFPGLFVCRVSVKSLARSPRWAIAFPTRITARAAASCRTCTRSVSGWRPRSAG